MDKKILERFCDKIPGYKEYYMLEKQNLDRFNKGLISREEYIEGVAKIQEEFNKRFNNLIK